MGNTIRSVIFLCLAVAVRSEQVFCESSFDHDGNIITFLEHFAANNMDCANHGPKFSAWGKALCPNSFQEIYDEAKKNIEKADGGKSGNDVLITDNFVIKAAEDNEVESVGAVIEDISERNGDMESLIAPICRVIRVAQPGGSFPIIVTVSLRMQIKHPHMFPEVMLFDLKGNFGYRARIAGPGKKTKKDGDFWKKFPDGVHITDPSVLEDMTKRIVRDVDMLSNRGIMDFSLLLQMAEWCEHPVKSCAEQISISAPRGTGPQGKPFKLGTFRKTCVRTDKGHMNRPVYVNVNDAKEFFYYYHGAWRIGKDIYNNDASLFQLSDRRCPDSRSSFQSEVGGKTRLVDVKMKDEHAQNVFQSKDAIIKANPHVPLAFATASTQFGKKTYVMTYTLTDLFVPEGNKAAKFHKHYANQLGTIVTAATCRQDDIDPLDASPYRARFLMMWNHRVKDEPCLSKNAYFTYFTRTADGQAVGTCPEGESRCKSLCDHLGLTSCGEMLTPCKTIFHQYGVGHFWRSSQAQLEDMFSKNIWDTQVMHYVEAIREEINFMDQDKRDKYETCHVPIKQALEAFVDSTRTPSNNAACGIDDEGQESCKIGQGDANAGWSNRLFVGDAERS